MPAKPSSAASVSSSAARVWTTTGFPVSAATAEQALETASAGRRAARSRGSSRGRSRRRRPRAGDPEAPSSWSTASTATGACLVRVEPEDGVDALVAIGEVERGPAAVDRRADGEDAADARLERAGTPPRQDRRARRGARGCRSRRRRRRVDAREERRSGLDPLDRLGHPGARPGRATGRPADEAPPGSAARSPADTARARRRRRRSRRRGRRARCPARPPCLVLGQVPRRRRLDVLVERTNRLPDRRRARR